MYRIKYAVLLISCLFLAAFWHGVVGIASCQTLGSLTCDANGWTQFVVGPGGFCEGTTACSGAAANKTQIIYVDPASGSDSNDGSFSSPIQTPIHGVTLLRSGSPDWLLLKCGTTFQDQSFGFINNRPGFDATHPMLYSSYDAGAAHNPPVPDPSTCSARPIIQVTATWTGGVNGPGVMIFQGGTASNNTAVVGIDFYGESRDPANGAYNSTEGQSNNYSGLGSGNITANVLFEDNRVRFMNQGIQSGSGSNYVPVSSVYVRRNQFISNYPSISGVAQGIFGNNIANGPTGYNFYENLSDHNGWNTDDSISWAPLSGRNHEIYMSQNTVNGDILTFGTPGSVIGNIFSNDGGGELFEVGGLVENNLMALMPSPINTQQIINYPHVVSGNVMISPDNLGAAGGLANSIEVHGRDFLGYPGTVPGASISMTGNFAINATVDPGAFGILIDGGTNAVTTTGNVVYNWGRTQSVGITTTSGSLLTQHVSTAGSGYTDKSVAISAAASSNSAGNADGQNYIVATVANVTGIQTTAGIVMYQVGSGAILGPYIATIIDSTHVEIFGTSFGSTFTGTLYFPYYQTALSNVSSTCAGSPSADLISAGGIIVAIGIGGSDGPTEKKDAPGNSCTAGDTLSASVTGGSGLVITLDTVTANTTASLGCNTTTNNVVDLTGANSCSFTDPNRTLGSYYATLSGATANATFTGVIDVNGTLTVSALTGTINLGDAVTFSGQTKADFIKGNSTTSNSLCTVTCTGAGSTGTYALTGINKSVSSGAMSSWAAQQFINLARNQFKGGWNTNYTACAANKYIKAGFGVTDPCNVNQ